MYERPLYYDNTKETYTHPKKPCVDGTYRCTHGCHMCDTSILQCVAVCCSVLQCVAVCCSDMYSWVSYVRHLYTTTIHKTCVHLYVASTSHSCSICVIVMLYRSLGVLDVCLHRCSGV